MLFHSKSATCIQDSLRPQIHLQPLTALTSWRNPTTTQSQNLRVLPETQALRGKLNLPHLPARHTCHEHREQDVFDTSVARGSTLALQEANRRLFGPKPPGALPKSMKNLILWSRQGGVCVCVCGCGCVRACVRACVRVCVSVCVF